MSDWQSVCIGEIASIPKKQPVANPQAIELLTVRLYAKGVERTGKYPRATERGRPYFAREAGEILIGRQNFHNGGIGIVGDADGGLICSNAITSLAPTPQADRNFLFYLLSNEEFRKQIQRQSEGTGQSEISESKILSLEILLPPLPEQKKIAEILSGIDTTIKQASQRIAKYKTLLWATLEQVFDPLSGNALLVPLGDCCRRILDFRGRTPAKLGMEWGGGTIRALSANNVRDGFIDFSRECYLGSESLYRNWMTRGDCKRGDIVFTMEAPMGNVAIIPDNEKYILSQRVVLLSPDRQQILPEYLYWFMRSSRFKDDCENLATGTTAKGIKQANLITISVPIATLEEQAKAVQSPTAIERLISSDVQRLSQLNLIKQSLSADLLSGRKRVSV